MNFPKVTDLYLWLFFCYLFSMGNFYNNQMRCIEDAFTCQTPSPFNITNQERPSIYIMLNGEDRSPTMVKMLSEPNKRLIRQFSKYLTGKRFAHGMYDYQRDPHVYYHIPIPKKINSSITVAVSSMGSEFGPIVFVNVLNMTFWSGEVNIFFRAESPESIANRLVKMGFMKFEKGGSRE